VTVSDRDKDEILAFLTSSPAPGQAASAGGSAVFSYADAVTSSAPSVVTIYTSKTVTEKPHPLLDDPIFSQFFGDQLKRRQRSHNETNLGSGVIIGADGYILTNQHVIDGADEILISLADGRGSQAVLIGEDKDTDIAILQIPITGLVGIRIADAQAIRVGDVVLAIGNPLNVGQTVTMGIVSATGRNDRRSLLYEDFIQTDAAINAGNSGGALVNANGDLIGISTRKLGASTGAQNIGFAIPVSMAKRVMEQIIEYGTVRRAWLGATFVDIRPTLQPDGSVARSGIAVGWVAQQGPAWEAGIRQGDVIVSLDGQPVTDASQFQLAISERDPGSKVELGVNRRLESFQTYATLIQQPPLQ